MSTKEVVELKGKTCIYYSNKGKVLRLPTGILWKDRLQPKNEQLINSLVKKLQDIIWAYRMDHDGSNPTRDHVRAMMKGESFQKDSLIDYYREFYGYKTDQVKNGNLQPNSLIDYKTLRTVLMDFEKLSKTKFQLTDITEDFVNRFKSYLLTKRNLNNNSTLKRLKSLKVFINYCVENKYFKPDFTFSKIKMKGYDPTVISLTEDEFQQLLKWDAGKYEKVKDAFIFGCLTSLRFSDIIKIRNHDITNNQIIMRSVKTDVQHVIPLTTHSKSILGKYSYNLNFFTVQTYNRLLKKMAKESGIFDGEVTVVVQQGNEKKEIRKPKWECFGSHLARRTNITRNISKNIPLNIVMGIAGLKRMDTVLKYMDKFGGINEYSKKLE